MAKTETVHWKETKDRKTSKDAAVVVQLLSCVWIFVTPTDCKFLSFTDARSLLKLMSIESMKLSKHLIFCCPFLLLPSIFPSIRVFSNESGLCIRWPKDWSFSNSPFNEYSGLTSFQIDWFDLLAVQGTLKSFPALQIEGKNSSTLSLLYGPTLTSIHDYWKNHSFDDMDLFWQSDVFAFSYIV